MKLLIIATSDSPPATNGKPLSAIAAARLKAEAAAKGTITLEITTEPVLSPSEVLPSVPTSEQQQLLLDPAAAEERDEDGEEEASITKQNLKLCTWQNKPQHILSDTEHEITVKLSKHTTIALIGCFRFIVLRGAININGANIGASSRENHEDRVHTAYVPATHPISKIRGLDGVNHVQFIDCPEPRPLADTGTLFANIWNMQDPHLRSRSFSIVSELHMTWLRVPHLIYFLSIPSASLSSIS
jgi:polynucleotide 5'-hydroxyl-kinase GRC3/NOL9